MPTPDAFVGRAEELTLLAEELRRVRAGEPRLVWLTGEAGIGKTTLLRQFVGSASGVQLLWAGGDESEVDVPYGVFLQLLSGLPVRGSLAGELRPESDPLAVGAALLSGLGALQAFGPVIVVVDDAQWADDRSTQALVFVLRRLVSDHVLVLLSSRSDPAPASGHPWERALALSQLTCRLPLGGLSAQDLQRLAPTVDGVNLSPAACRRLHEHTGGHPLYARALLEELPPEALTETSGVLPAPRSLASLVLVRLAKLSAAAQTLVLAVTVLGSRCSLADAVKVAAVADPVGALDEAVRAGLLVQGPPGRPRDVAFPHLLIRGAIYADLPPARRHALHRRAAEVLGGAPALTHRVAAAVGPDEELALELEESSRSEVRQQSWRSAAEHLLAAADLSETAVEKGRRMVSAVGTMLTGGDIAQAARFESAVRAAPLSSARSRVLGQLALFTGRLAAAHDELSAALKPIGEPAEADADRALVAAHLALLSMVEGDLDRAVTLAVQALGANPGTEIGALARFALVVGLAGQGRRAEVELFLGPLTKASSSPVAPLERDALRGVLALWSGQEAEAAEAISHVLRQSAPGLLMQARILLLGFVAEALYRLGDWDGATAQADLALSLSQDTGILLASGATHAVASYPAAGRGSWATAEARVAASVRAAESLPWWASRAYAATAQATLAQARGDYAGMREALAAFDDPAVVDRVDALGVQAWRALLVEALLGLGLLDAGEAELKELVSRTVERPPGWCALEAARLGAWLAELRGEAGSIRPAYEDAMQLAEQVQAALSRARLETAYGRFLLSQGERRPALDVLRTAHDRLERLGAKPFLAACDELLHTAGLRPPTEGDPLGFTAQELAVARLVASGRTNSEAGLELFITSRTVAFHLSNIYAKAGISSRRDLAERFPQLLS